MWSICRWLKKDHAGHAKARAAMNDAEIISRRIDEEIKEDKIRARALQEIRERNHLAELFDEAFSMRRRGEER